MKLIAIDLDGTLLSEDGLISKENVEAIRVVRDHGDIVVISSGRSFLDTNEILQKANLDCPFIAGNGAISFHKGKTIHKFTLDSKIVSELIEVLEKHHCFFEIYTKNGVFIKIDGRELLLNEIETEKQRLPSLNDKWAFHEIDAHYNLHGLLPISNYLDIDFTTLEVYKIFVLSFDSVKLTRLREIIMKRIDISVTSSGLQNIDMGHLEATKGNALKIIGNYFGVPLNHSVAIGDNLNDLSMFNIAGLSIAMGNAVKELKEKATYITKNNNENGVAHAIRNYILPNL